VPQEQVPLEPQEQVPQEPQEQVPQEPQEQAQQPLQPPQVQVQPQLGEPLQGLLQPLLCLTLLPLH
jgi:hypothetical protein